MPSGLPEWVGAGGGDPVAPRGVDGVGPAGGVVDTEVGRVVREAAVLDRGVGVAGVDGFAVAVGEGATGESDIVGSDVDLPGAVAGRGAAVLPSAVEGAVC